MRWGKQLLAYLTLFWLTKANGSFSNWKEMNSDGGTLSCSGELFNLSNLVMDVHQYLTDESTDSTAPTHSYYVKTHSNTQIYQNLTLYIPDRRFYIFLFLFFFFFKHQTQIFYMQSPLWVIWIFLILRYYPKRLYLVAILLRFLAIMYLQVNSCRILNTKIMCATIWSFCKAFPSHFWHILSFISFSLDKDKTNHNYLHKQVKDWLSIHSLRHKQKLSVIIKEINSKRKIEATWTIFWSCFHRVIKSSDSSDWVFFMSVVWMVSKRSFSFVVSSPPKEITQTNMNFEGNRSIFNQFSSPNS